MKKEYEALFTPLRIGNVEIRNRFAMAPMAMGQLDDHWAYKQESIDHFTERVPWRYRSDHHRCQFYRKQNRKAPQGKLSLSAGGPAKLHDTAKENE